MQYFNIATPGNLIGKRKSCSKQELLLWFTFKRNAFNIWIIFPTPLQIGLLAQNYIGTFEFVPVINTLQSLALEESDWRCMGQLQKLITPEEGYRMIQKSLLCKKELLSKTSFESMNYNFPTSEVKQMITKAMKRNKSHLDTLMKIFNTKVRGSAPIVIAKFQKRQSAFSNKVADERRMIKLINNFRRQRGNVNLDIPVSTPEINFIGTTKLTEAEEDSIADDKFADGEEAELKRKLELCFPIKKQGGKICPNPLAIQADAELSAFFKNKNYLENILDGYSSIKATTLATRGKHSRQDDLRRINNKIVTTLNNTKSQLEQLMLEAETAINAIIAADSNAKSHQEYACNLLNYDLSKEMRELLYPDDHVD